MGAKGSNFLLRWETWVYGLLAGFIGGGAQAVVTSVTVTAIAPDKFNLGAQLHNFLLLMAVTFLASGLLSAAAYLAKSPLPQLITTTTAEQIVQPTDGGGVSIKTIATTTEQPAPDHVVATVVAPAPASAPATTTTPTEARK